MNIKMDSFEWIYILPIFKRFYLYLLYGITTFIHTYTCIQVLHTYTCTVHVATIPCDYICAYIYAYMHTYSCIHIHRCFMCTVCASVCVCLCFFKWVSAIFRVRWLIHMTNFQFLINVGCVFGLEWSLIFFVIFCL